MSKTATPKKKGAPRGRAPEPQPKGAGPFALALRAARLARGRSQESLADACRLSARSVGHYERSQEPPLYAAMRLARELGISLDGLALPDAESEE